ncbi:ABC1 family protein [Branchiibius hedensis]|uniref:ABC1 family protein n=1 Tax=Branchiibius hedensis TaxID=672460 RepID=A0A2Y8ZLE6_9MICO|nr:AarF/ABC1/UbiB kinase family protein [Branchiibius hedensis]PWJ24343.1 ABC1 family protein [Branchiibius hedensis]SSA33160.1 ABC1 family protein [Branchiibius hedensis]
MARVPRNSVSRTARLATLPIGYGARQTIGLGKRVGGASAEAVTAQIQEQTAAQIFKVLGTLKGGAMKVGQSMSVFEAALPEELVGPYRTALTKLQDAAPAMPVKLVHKQLTEQLGSRWRSYLRDFDDTPVAAASIGQVHRAVWKDGRPVAVKIQYPGAGEALLSDIAQLSRVMRLTTSWVPGLELRPLLEEIRERMREELDYTLEATMQRQFAAAYADDEWYAVPNVLADTPGVIVSEWIEGIPLSRIIAEGTNEQRDLAASLYLEFLVAAPGRAGLLHADPHPGNFRLLPDGRLGVLDFGAVNRLPEGMPAAMGHLLTAAVDADADELLAGLRAEGFVRESIDVAPEAVLDYLSVFVEPLQDNAFQFNREWLRSVFNRINDPRSPNFSVGIKLNLPPAYLLIHRAWLGGIAVLCQINGVAPVREIINDYLPGSDLPPV